MPLAALTAVVGLYSSIKLDLPQPWSPATKPTPLLIYGASSAVGYYVLQLALKSNLHPLICIAGRASGHVDRLLDRSQGDAIVDYRQSNEDVAKGIKDALKGEKLEYAYDAVSEKGSYQIISEVLDKKTGKITLVLPPKVFSPGPVQRHMFCYVPRNLKYKLTYIHCSNRRGGILRIARLIREYLKQQQMWALFTET